jgi:hypothetical protein
VASSAALKLILGLTKPLRASVTCRIGQGRAWI